MPVEDIPMGFVKTFEQIMAGARATADFYDAEMLTVFWETKPEIVARLVPAPLEPAALPIAMAFVAWYPATNFETVYRETALFIRVKYQGEEGSYCLAMPVTSDMAMAGGREVFGFPKKMADIHYSIDGDAVHGWTERRGVRFMEIRASLTGKCNDEGLRAAIEADCAADGTMKGVAFNFKYFPAPEGGAMDYHPRLVRQETIFRPRQKLYGEAEITLRDSPYDPWTEVEVVRTLGAMYTKGDNSMLGGRVVAEVDPIRFAPYAFLKWDMK